MDNISDTRVEHNDQILEVLNSTSIQLLEIKQEEEIFKVMAEAIGKLLPGAYSVVSKLQADDMNFRVVHTHGLDKFVDAIRMLIGKNPYEIDFPFKDLESQHREGFISRKLYYLEDGLYGLSVGAIPRAACRAIEKLVGISQIYAISFYMENNYFGGISIWLPKRIIKRGGLSPEVALAIETLSNYASVLIQKFRNNQELRQSQKKLENSYNKFNLLLNNLTDIAWRANGDGSNLEDLNQSFERIYGHTTQEFSENPNLWYEQIHPDDLEIYQKSADELFRNGNAKAEYRVKRKDGSTIWLNDRKSIIYDEEGKPILMGGIAKDITDRKKLEDELKIKNYALDLSPVAVGLADFDGKLIFANEAFVKLWNYPSKEDVLGKHVSAFAHSKQQMETVLNTIREGGIYWGEGQSVKCDGSLFDSIISATMVKHDGVPLCLMATFTDISEQKRLEGKLNEMIMAKDQLFSIIAHDLKSPFNTFLGFTHILSNDYSHIKDEDRITYIHLIRDSADSTYKLLENLLEWSRLQTSTYEVHSVRFKLKNLIDECTALYAATAENKRITVLNQVDAHATVFVDGNALTTVLRNLLNNALKYTKDGGIIRFTSQQTGSLVDLSVQDNGIGIKPELLSKLYHIGETVSTPGTNHETGTGLGLILCKELLERNNGSLHVESVYGEGTTFHVRLPA